MFCFVEVDTLCLRERFKVTRPAYFNVETFRVIGTRVSRRVSRSRLLVSISFDFGKYGLEPRVKMSSEDNQDKQEKALYFSFT